MRHGEKAKKEILEAGLKIWRKNPRDLTARAIAREIGKTHSAVLYWYSADTLFDAVAKYAVQMKDARVIVQLIAMSHPAVMKLPDKEKLEYINTVKSKK